MAKQVAKNLLGNLGDKLKKALKSHKDEETVSEDFSGLPAGIDSGVARIVEDGLKIGQYKTGPLKGKAYFMGMASVIMPKTFVTEDGVKVKTEGRFTQIGPEPLCDTLDRKGEKARRTIDDHVDWILKQLRTIGRDTSDIDDEDSLQEALDELNEEKPYIIFRTWKGKATKEFPNPRTNHQWVGLYDEEDLEDDDEDVEDETPVNKKKSKKVEDEEPEDDEDEVDEDDTEDEEVEEVSVKKKGKGKEKTEVKGGKKPPKPPKKVAVEEEDDEEAFDDGAVNLDELAEEADGGDKKAAKKLNELAADKGVKRVRGMTFADLVEKMNGTEDEEEDEDEDDSESDDEDGNDDDSEDDTDSEDEDEDDEEEYPDPQVDEVYAYLPEGKDPKTKKPFKKPIQVVVMKVRTKDKTVDLMDNKTKVKYPKVPWLDLQQVD